jgi:hypothetical protein
MVAFRAAEEVGGNSGTNTIRMKRISGVASPTKTATPPDFVLAPDLPSRKQLVGGRLSSYAN